MNRILHRIKEHFSSDRSSPTGAQEQDLFEYAIRSRLQPDRSPESEQKKKRRRFIPLIFFVVIPASVAGGWGLGELFESGDVNRYGVVHYNDQTTEKVYIRSLNSNELSYSALNDEGIEPEDSTAKINTENITRIDFLPNPERDDEKEKQEQREIPADARKFLGRYVADISGHRADFVVYKTKNGYVGAFLKFHDWGAGRREYLKRLRIRGDRISFIRSCQGQECVRIGSPNHIRQEYAGTISPNHDKIKGTYTGGRNASRWIAIRRR